MPIVKILVTADGRFKHVYNDNLLRMDKALGDIHVSRASHVEFDNIDHTWRVSIEGTLLPERFADRSAALNFEVGYLEENCLRE